MASPKPSPQPIKVEAKVKVESTKPVDKIDTSKPLMFGKMNYQMMIVGIVVLLVGFMLMAGGASTDPNNFNGEEKYSFRRISLAPFVVVLGFVIEIVACFWNKKSS